MRTDVASLQYEVGEWEEAIGAAEEILEWSEATGGAQVGVGAAMAKAQVLAARGAVREAADMTGRFLPVVRQIADPQLLVPALLIAASVERARGNLHVGADLVREFIALTADLPMYRLFDVPGAVRTLLDAGHREAAERMVEGQDPQTLRERCSFLTAQAILAETRGDAEAGLELYDEADGLWARQGYVLRGGETLLGAGRCLLALGRPEEATARLRGAREVFADLGAGPLAAEADALLQRATGTGA